MIGDRVGVYESDAAWTIESVAKRATELVRRGRGGRSPKVLVANLDHVFVVVALKSPPATTALIDRMLALVESSGMHPMLVLNKLDLEGGPEAAEGFSALYQSLGYRVFPTSVAKRSGLRPLIEEVTVGTSAFIGPSGAGKSSLLNALDPTLDLQTGALSRKTGTGRHTTVGSRLIPLSIGGLVADTPGFGDVGLWAVPPGAVENCFPEFATVAEDCRFRACTHVHEPDCAVRAALERGEIFQSRYESYVALRAEAEDARQR